MIKVKLETDEAGRYVVTLTYVDPETDKEYDLLKRAGLRYKDPEDPHVDTEFFIPTGKEVEEEEESS